MALDKLTNYTPLAEPISFIPAGAISAGQPVGLNGQVAAADAKCLGICLYDVASTDPTGAYVIGEVSVTAHGTINVGDPIKWDGTGFVAGAVDTIANHVKNVGYCLEAATSGNKFRAFISPLS